MCVRLLQRFGTARLGRQKRSGSPGLSFLSLDLASVSHHHFSLSRRQADNTASRILTCRAAVSRLVASPSRTSQRLDAPRCQARHPTFGFRHRRRPPAARNGCCCNTKPQHKTIDLTPAACISSTASDSRPTTIYRNSTNTVFQRLSPRNSNASPLASLFRVSACRWVGLSASRLAASRATNNACA